MTPFYFFDELGEVQSVTGELSTDTTAYSP
jgi:hypothetical protein